MAKKVRVRLVLLGIGILILSAQLQSVAAGPQAADPSSFAERLIEMNRAEIQFSRIAMNKARDKGVADFAEALIRAHGVSLYRLKGSEVTKKYDLTAEHQDLLDALRGAEDSQFDLQFMAVMVHEQQRIIRLLEQEGGISRERRPGVRYQPPAIPGDMADVARELLPTQQELLSKAEDINRQLESASQLGEAIAR